MKQENKVNLFVGVLMSIATIAAALITTNIQTKQVAKNVANERINESLPELELFPLLESKTNSTHPLGKWQACALATAGTIHANQACTCIIERDSDSEDSWQLRFQLDEQINGACNCQAFCFNGLKKDLSGN